VFCLFFVLSVLLFGFFSCFVFFFHLSLFGVVCLNGVMAGLFFVIIRVRKEEEKSIT